MRRAILLMAICLALSGCGAFRKVFKLKESHKVEIIQERRTDSVGVTVDRSTITTVERIDTVVNTPARTVSQESVLNMDSLINGMTAIKNDLIDVSLHLNPITGMLNAVATIKAQAIPVRFDRVTTKKNDITQSSRKQEAVLSSTRVEDEKKEVTREPIKIPIWLIILIIVISVIGGLLFWWKKGRQN